MLTLVREHGIKSKIFYKSENVLLIYNSITQITRCTIVKKILTFILCRTKVWKYPNKTEVKNKNDDNNQII